MCFQVNGGVSGIINRPVNEAHWLQMLGDPINRDTYESDFADQRRRNTRQDHARTCLSAVVLGLHMPGGYTARHLPRRRCRV